MKNTIAVATKHGKLSQIQPTFVLLPEWELKLAEIDTDQFGTFSGEVARAHNLVPSHKDRSFAQSDFSRV